MKRKILAIFLILTMCLSLLPTAALAEGAGTGHWADSAVDALNGIYEDAFAFDPEEFDSVMTPEAAATVLTDMGRGDVAETLGETFTRAEACAVLAEVFDLPVGSNETAISYLYDRNIINGKANGDLDETGDISQAAFAVLTYRVLNSVGGGTGSDIEGLKPGTVEYYAWMYLAVRKCVPLQSVQLDTALSEVFLRYDDAGNCSDAEGEAEDALSGEGIWEKWGEVLGLDEDIPESPATEAGLENVTLLDAAVAMLDALSGDGRPQIFSDVAPSDWWYDGVMYFADRGIVVGYGDGTFGYADGATRRTLAGLLYKVHTDGQGEGGAAGVEAAITYVTDQEYMTPPEWDDGSWWDAWATREEAVVAILKYLEDAAEGGDAEFRNYDESILDRFQDKAAVSEAARPYMAYAVSLGIVNGTQDGRLMPGQDTVRAELCLLFYRTILGVDQTKMQDYRENIENAPKTQEESGLMQVSLLHWAQGSEDAPIAVTDNQTLELSEDWRLTSDLFIRVAEGKTLTIVGNGHHIYDLGGQLKNTGKGYVVLDGDTQLYQGPGNLRVGLYSASNADEEINYEDPTFLGGEGEGIYAKLAGHDGDEGAPAALEAAEVLGWVMGDYQPVDESEESDWAFQEQPDFEEIFQIEETETNGICKVSVKEDQTALRPDSEINLALCAIYKDANGIVRQSDPSGGVNVFTDGTQLVWRGSWDETEEGYQHEMWLTPQDEWEVKFYSAEFGWSEDEEAFVWNYSEEPVDLTNENDYEWLTESENGYYVIKNVPWGEHSLKCEGLADLPVYSQLPDVGFYTKNDRTTSSYITRLETDTPDELVGTSLYLLYGEDTLWGEGEKEYHFTSWAVSFPDPEDEYYAQYAIEEFVQLDGSKLTFLPGAAEALGGFDIVAQAVYMTEDGERLTEWTPECWLTVCPTPYVAVPLTMHWNGETGANEFTSADVTWWVPLEDLDSDESMKAIQDLFERLKASTEMHGKALVEVYRTADYGTDSFELYRVEDKVLAARSGRITVDDLSQMLCVSYNPDKDGTVAEAAEELARAVVKDPHIRVTSTSSEEKQDRIFHYRADMIDTVPGGNGTQTAQTDDGRSYTNVVTTEDNIVAEIIMKEDREDPNNPGSFIPRYPYYLEFGEGNFKTDLIEPDPLNPGYGKPITEDAYGGNVAGTGGKKLKITLAQNCVAVLRSVEQETVNGVIKDVYVWQVKSTNTPAAIGEDAVVNLVSAVPNTKIGSEAKENDLRTTLAAQPVFVDVSAAVTGTAYDAAVTEAKKVGAAVVVEPSVVATPKVNSGTEIQYDVTADLLVRSLAADGSVIGTDQKVSLANTKESVELTLPVPADWAVGKTVYVKHTKTDGSSYYYQAAVKTRGDGTEHFITLTQSDGFSPFVLSTSSFTFGSSSSGSSSNTKTETTKNPDGSTTTTTTDKVTGTTTEVTKNTDGSTVTVETKKDGTVTTTMKESNGTTGIVVTNDDGDITGVAASVSSTAVKEAAQTGGTVTLPVEVTAANSTDDAPEVEISVSSSAAKTGVKVEIPVEDVTPGTVVVLVDSKGNETVVPMTQLTEDGVVINVTEDVTVKIVDNSRDFPDVPATHAFADETDFASARGIIEGYPNGTFGVVNPATSNAVVTVIARTLGEQFYGATAVAEAAEWAAEQGLTEGLDMTGNVSRETYMTILWRAEGMPMADLSVLGDFTDAHTLSNLGKLAMAWAVDSGLINGYPNGIIDPNGNISRGAMAAIAMRYVQLT